VLSQHVGMGVEPDTRVFGCDSAICLNGCGFQHNQTGLLSLVSSSVMPEKLG
jgi:hypothetical protein